MLQDINFMVKYCGGCNSYYDRGKMVKKIEEKAAVRIIPYKEGCIPDMLLIVKGCRSECINIGEYRSKYGIFVLEDKGEFNTIVEQILKKLANITSSKGKMPSCS